MPDNTERPSHFLAGDASGGYARTLPLSENRLRMFEIGFHNVTIVSPRTTHTPPRMICTKIKLPLLTIGQRVIRPVLV